MPPTTYLPSLDPVLEPGIYVYCSLPPGTIDVPSAVVASIREPEGLSVIVTEATAEAMAWRVLMRVAWIRFGQVTDIAAVGLTVAVSAALGQAGIPCNMVAGAYHDHVFVPVDQAAEALELLKQLRVTMANRQ